MTTWDQVAPRLRNMRSVHGKSGEYESYSPFRATSDHHSFWMRIAEDGEHGVWKDHVSGEFGSLYELADHLGVERPENGANRLYVASTKRAYEGLADYAQAHGADVSVFAAAGWREVEYKGRRGLQFPTEIGDRIRFLDDANPRYLPVEGTIKTKDGRYTGCLYGFRRAVNMAKEHSLPLVVCNGEASVVVAQHAGIPAFCQNNGERAFTQEHLKSVQESWRGGIVIALDCDDTGKRVANEIAGQLGAQARVVDLGFTDHGDLADFVMLHGDGAMERLEALAAGAGKADSQKTPQEQIISAIDALKQVIRDRNKSESDIETAIVAAQSVIEQVSMGILRPVVVTFSDAATESRNEYSSVREMGGADIIGLRSNWKRFDGAIGGFPEDLLVMLACTGIGKSWMMVSLARELNLQAPGLIATTEMSTKLWFRRLLASTSFANYTDLKHGRSSSAEWDRIQSEMDRYGRVSSAMVDNPSPTPKQIRTAFAQGLDAGMGWEYLMVDSASKMSYPGTGDNIYARMSAVMNGLQDISREFKIPVLVSLQAHDLDDKPAHRRIPQMSDAYGGIVAVQNAGIVASLYNHHYYVKKDLAEEDPNMPNGTVLLRFLKIRDEDDSEAPAIKFGWTGAGYTELPVVSLRRD